MTGYPTPSVVGCYDYYPFGEMISCGGTITNHKFTGKERDGESNLGNFFARYYSSALGRFMSPDPGNAGADPGNPQTWVFSNSQFTEHLDSAFLYNPIGFLIHLFKDVLGVGGHSQCP